MALELVNWMGVSAQSENINIIKQASPAPLVKIAGEVKFEAPSSQEITFVGTGEPSRCVGAKQTGLTFEWTVDPVVYGLGQAWGSNKRSLLVPANTLDTDTTYIVTLRVFQGTLSSTASVQVKTVASPPVAKLSAVIAWCLWHKTRDLL